MEGTTAVITSASTESAAPSSAGSAAAPSSTSITPDQRPTFAQAFANDAALSTDTTTQPEGATTPPVAATDAQSAINPITDKPGPMPFEAHKTALENARTKTRTEMQAEFDRDFAWAKAAPRQEWQRMAEIAAELSNPPAFLEKYFAEAVAHPTHGAQVKSWAAKALASRIAPAETMPGPDVQIVDAQGHVTGMTYSDKQLAARDAFTEKQVLGKVNEELKPFKQEREQKEAAAKADAFQKKVDAYADNSFKRIDKILDGDKTLHKLVGDLFMSDPNMDPIDAALQVREQHKAQFEAKAESKVLETLKTKAGAQSVNPASAVVASTKRPTSFHDKGLTW